MLGVVLLWQFAKKYNYTDIAPCSTQQLTTMSNLNYTKQSYVTRVANTIDYIEFTNNI